MATPQHRPPATPQSARPATTDDGNRQEMMRVVARVRPLLDREVDSGEDAPVQVGRRQIVVENPTTALPSTFRLDDVLDPNADQGDVFSLIQHQLDEALEGFNTTVFAYGQTGTGKTFTMLGTDFWQLHANQRDSRSPSDGSDIVESLMTYSGEYHPAWGIIPRAMAYLFRRLQVGGVTVSPSGSTRSRFRLPGAIPQGVSVCVSYFEIYNEKVYDLLREENSASRATHRGPGASSGLDIVHDKHRGVLVPEAVNVQVTSEEEVLALLWEGAKNRLLASTDMNEHSSRSHTIWQVTIERRQRRPRKRNSSAAGPVTPDGSGDGVSYESTDTIVTHAKINFVDLAGSEKIRSYQLDAFSERRLTELTSINQSLSSLGNCIRALSKRNRSHVPYRDSKLTRLLQDSLGGNCKTTFIVTLSPAPSSVEESLSSLQFADRAKRVEVHASKNETLDDATLVERYRQEIARLKSALKSQARRAEASSSSAAASGGETAREQAEEVAEMSELREEVQRWRRTALETQEALEAAENTRREQLLGFVGRVTRDAGPEAKEVAKVMRAVEAERSNLAARDRRLSDAEKEAQTRATALRQYYEWLRALPTIPMRPNSSLGEEAAMNVSQRLSLLEGTVKQLEKELQHGRESFLKDLERLQGTLDARAETLASLVADQSETSQEEQRLQEQVNELRAENARWQRHAAELEAQHPDAATTVDDVFRAQQEAEQRWSHHVDKSTLRSYWHNTAEGFTQWERPEELNHVLERERRKRMQPVVEKFRSQVGRLFHAVSEELQRQLVGIVEQHVPPEACRATKDSLREETSRYQRETADALDREVTLLAAGLELR